MSRRALVVGFALATLWTNGGSWAQAAPSNNRQTPLVRAVKRVRPAVVNIHSQKNVSSANPLHTGGTATPSRLSGMGTGVILDPRGYIMTNHHVIEDVTGIRVTLVDGETLPAEVLGRDPETDLALLKVNTDKPLSVMPLGISEDLMHGETVVAIGNAYGYEHTVTRGIISELHRDVRLSEKQSYRDLIQTDASINPGNSGGPLINVDGEMIGLNVAIRAGAQGIGFAIPVREVKRIATKLMSVRRLKNLWHGINTDTIESDESSDSRVIVQHVEAASPAQQAGIRPGDRIVRVGGTLVVAGFDIERALMSVGAGQSVPVTIERNGRESQVALVVASAPSIEADPVELVWQKVGVKLASGPKESDIRRISAQLRGGLKVVEVAETGPASRAGLMTGDILVGLHLWETLSIRDVAYAIKRENREDHGPIRFFVIRGGQIQRGLLSVDEE